LGKYGVASDENVAVTKYISEILNELFQVSIEILDSPAGHSCGTQI
jgi:hypothetical protein